MEKKDGVGLKSLLDESGIRRDVWFPMCSAHSFIHFAPGMFFKNAQQCLLCYDLMTAFFFSLFPSPGADRNRFWGY